MNIGELIDRLEEFPPAAQVVIATVGEGEVDDIRAIGRADQIDDANYHGGSKIAFHAIILEA